MSLQVWQGRNTPQGCSEQFEYTSFSEIIQNQLYVADHSDLVKIFDTDCNVVGTIQTKECPYPYDIAVGEDGLYVVSRYVPCGSCRCVCTRTVA